MLRLRRDSQVDELVDQLGVEVGSVNVFVSHSWNTKWSTLMKMIERLDNQLHTEGTVTVGDPSSASHPAYMRAKKGSQAQQVIHARLTLQLH
jgi:ABC-type proline/glycine betaine transport system ATPase subunit